MTNEQEQARYLYEEVKLLLPDAVEIHHDIIIGVCVFFIDQIFKRDKNWIDVLSEKYPEDYSIEEHEKLINRFNNIKNELLNL